MCPTALFYFCPQHTGGRHFPDFLHSHRILKDLERLKKDGMKWHEMQTQHQLSVPGDRKQAELSVSIRFECSISFSKELFRGLPARGFLMCWWETDIPSKYRSPHWLAHSSCGLFPRWTVKFSGSRPCPLRSYLATRSAVVLLLFRSHTLHCINTCLWVLPFLLQDQVPFISVFLMIFFPGKPPLILSSNLFILFESV